MMILGNPIFLREFISTARAWKTRLIIGAYLLALSVLLLLLWPTGGVQSVVTEGSRQIYSMFFCVNLALLLLVIPAFSASSITLERERGTYNALFTTLLTPMDIMAGKLAAAVLMVLILTTLSLPIASICALTGGVDLNFMLRMIVLLFLTAVTYGLIGLACSSICRRTTNAILLTYVCILLFTGATWLPSALLSNLLPPEFNGLWQMIRSISPFDAILYLLFPDSYKLTTSVELSQAVFTPYTTFLTASVILSACAFTVFFNHVLQTHRKSRKQGEIHHTHKEAMKRKLSWPFYLFDPLKRKKMIGRFQNPVFVAEMRSKLFSNPQFVIRTVSAIFIISLTLLTLIAFQFGSTLSSGMIRMVAIIFEIGVVALLAPGVSSGLITDEITGGTFNALRMTTLTPFTLISGKLKATFFYALIFIISSAFVLFAMAYLEPQDLFPEASIVDPAFWSSLLTRIQGEGAEWWGKLWGVYWRICIWVVILLLSTMTFLCGGLFASSIAKNTAVATMTAYLFTAFICIVTMLPVPLADKMSHGLSRLLLSFNPIVAALQVTGDAFPAYPRLWVSNIYAMVFLILLFLTGSILRVWHLFRKQG